MSNKSVLTLYHNHYQKVASAVVFTTVFGILCDFFNVLPFKRKNDGSYDILLFNKAKFERSKYRARYKGFQ